jgi:hypothetical protein
VSEFPAQVYRIPDSGIHSLTARRTMDMARIAQEKSVSLVEMIGHPVMDPITGKPVYLGNLDVQLRFYLAADVVELKILAVRELWRYQPD